MLSGGRKIIHVDMDAFYASVEIRDNPALAGKPIAVGGPSDSRGVISTCSYEARAFGVRSAMPSSEAKRLCPELILLRGRMQAYKDASAQVRAIFHHYTDIVEPLSLDEAYLDVSASRLFQGSATLLAQQIRSDIYKETQLTASAGIAPNKFLAKVASDMNKPNGQFVIPPDQCAEFAATLSLRKIPGVGPKTESRLIEKGLYTGRDVLQHTPEELASWLGSFGPVLHLRAQGIDRRVVQPNRESKSVGVETTLKHNAESEGACLDILKGLLPELTRRLRGRAFVGVQVKLKFHDFEQTAVSQQAVVIEDDLLVAMLSVAYQRGKGRSVRLVGVSVVLNRGDVRQLALDLEQ